MPQLQSKSSPAPTPNQTRRNVRIFAALGDETRLSLLATLSGGTSLSITHLTKGQSVTRQAVTKHLRILKHAGLVRNIRRGRENCFILEPDAIAQAKASLDRISQQWDIALHRLKSMLENEATSA